MYLVNGSVPAEQLEELVERIRRDPPFPGSDIPGMCERKGISVAEAARQIDLSVAELTEIIEGRTPVTPEIALRMEAAGWPSADMWMRMQSSYDLAQARLRREGKSSEHSPLPRAAPAVLPTS